MRTVSELLHSEILQVCGGHWEDMRNAYRNLLVYLLESGHLEDREEYGRMTLILLKRNIVRLGIVYSWLKIVAPTDIMVSKLQVWLPEWVVC
jgi:hypothetical protein